MKAMKSLLMAAIAAAGLAAIDTQAAGGHWSGGHPAGHVSGGHWGGGHWGGYRWYGPRVGLYFGAPLLWSAWYWGYPYDYYGPRTVVVERYPDSYPAEAGVEGAPTTQLAPRLESAPPQAPAYRNYCESAKAYFPKVTKCPEGWRFDPAR